ncbi:DUF2934 domain-containing protein [Marinobacter zhanjiangensis]|uniref:DUF2934 domain-containing protein n=1 Tax=Marinobacter zhanjiangensis TaxID=578215 RepID=A0ABQ3B304_9GAMM|nr:hypothetical protein GCM10007071_25620 [Marinobacter zhanjiangensis]
MTDEHLRIQEAAYYLWQAEGQPDQQDKRHWELARQMVRAQPSPAETPQADEPPSQVVSGSVPEEKPRRKTRSKTDQASRPKVKAPGTRKPTAAGAKKSTK